MDSFKIKTDQIPPEETDRLAIEWLMHRSEIEGTTAVVVLPQDARNTLYETLQIANTLILYIILFVDMQPKNLLLAAPDLTCV